MKHIRLFMLVSALVAVTLLVIACGPATPTPVPIKYRVRALFPIPVENFESAPQVIAMRMGYFAEEGVDLKYEGLGTVAGEGSKLVAEGQAEFALVAVPNVLAARAGGITVRSVFMEREEYIYDFAVRPDGGIKAFADMKGKKLGLGDPAWAVEIGRASCRERVS
jgi:ABC-type nitrate/sulfonate/bicarbonate transport system substrate-binding protein